MCVSRNDNAASTKHEISLPPSRFWRTIDIVVSNISRSINSAVGISLNKSGYLLSVDLMTLEIMTREDNEVLLNRSIAKYHRNKEKKSKFEMSFIIHYDSIYCHLFYTRR